ncbi:MAG: hypothetical protein CMI64_04190 [Pedosphaera sp.]|nr:hypothetical protein [Pedosphaera sp.]
MEKIDNLPLFLLGPDFFPGFNGRLRVFEPRYKQMMNDCILDSRPFGYIAMEPKAGELNGWGQPTKMGVLCSVSDYEESGSNLIIEIMSESVFEIEEVIQPVLPNVLDSERYPGVEELMEQAGNPVDGKLYIRAHVNLIDSPKQDYSYREYLEFIGILSPLKPILEMSSMFRGQNLDFERDSQVKDANQQLKFIWKICSSLCYDIELQQKMLSETSSSGLMRICIECAEEVSSRMGEE